MINLKTLLATILILIPFERIFAMTENINFNKADLWQVYGQTRCAGKLYINDFLVTEFDGKKNMTIQYSIELSYLVKGLQQIRIQLTDECKNIQITDKDFSLRLAGFKFDDFPAETKQDTLKENAFGQKPSWGLVALEITGNDFSKSGVAIKSGGNWSNKEVWSDFSEISLDSKTINSIEKQIQEIYNAVKTGNGTYMRELFTAKVNANFPEDVGLKDVPQNRTNELNNLKIRTESRPKQDGFELKSLPPTPWSIHLLDNKKIVEVTNLNNEALLLWSSKTNTRGKFIPLFKTIRLAMRNGKWIIF